jgi:putative MATE family efflux protein
MQDLTTGSISKHLLKTMSFMLVTMLFQTLYFLVDLYWVGRLGSQAVAAVGIAGNLNFLVLALSQMLGVGATAIISHAVGRKDKNAANHLFNQSQSLAIAIGAGYLVVGLVVAPLYTRTQSADAETAKLALQYLVWFIPAMAAQFPIAGMGSALRATGNFKPTMITGTVTVIINMVLAPVLIFGWGTGKAFGVAGAAMSTVVAVAVMTVWLSTYFIKKDSYLHFHFDHWKPELAKWWQMIKIGLPAGFEFAMMAVYLGIVYAITRPFGAAAQAGFGIGMRVIQAGFMPVVALGFSVAPVAGQNFGAKMGDRVKATFKDAAMIATAMMITFALASHIAPAALIGVFSKDPSAIAVGEEYLRIISWNYIASGLVFVSSSMFQAMGNTMPSLISSATRILLVAIPAITLSRLPGFQLKTIWYLSMIAVWAQLGMALWFLSREFKRRLVFSAPPTPAAPTEPAPAAA